MQAPGFTTKNIDFAILGHQDRWENVYSIINYMRGPSANPVAQEEIKYIFPFFPSRSLFKINLTSIYANKQITGNYIETFISPDSLDGVHLKENIQKVKQAAICAHTLKAPIATLGGFTSILLEGKMNMLPYGLQTVFTTGNTLTAAFIVQGVKDACQVLGKQIHKSHLLIIGATGDIGSACARYFAAKVAKLTLVARNKRKLSQLASHLPGASYILADNLNEYTSSADIVIAVASSSNMRLSGLKSGALVVDAGYPKNIDIDCIDSLKVHLMHGGMGYIRGNVQFKPDYRTLLYNFPLSKIAHGCILEAVVLAFENRHYTYSQGRGDITLDKMEDIYLWAQKHGIVPAPFYNHHGLWPLQKYTYDEYSEKSG
jgi:fatty aldehyde-generating acyl-ACP reductase